MPTILVVETDQQVLEHLLSGMREGGLNPTGTLDPMDALDSLQGVPPDAVLVGSEVDPGAKSEIEAVASRAGVPVVQPIGRLHWEEAVQNVLGPGMTGVGVDGLPGTDPLDPAGF